jgi:hypothetical protein
MDIKPYIDYFDEISHLKREQQFTLLELARDDIGTRSKLPILSLIPCCVHFTCLCFFVGGSFLVFGYSGWVLVLSFLLSLLCARFLITEITDALMLKALKRNLGDKLL